MNKFKLNTKRDVKGELLICCLCTITFVILGLITCFIFNEFNKETNVKNEKVIETESFLDEALEINVVKNENYIVGDYCCDSPIHNYTSEEILLLACTVYAEAGNCSDEHQMYVASVIMNRVNNENYPDTIHDVIYQTKPCLQYACTKNGAIEKALDKYNGNCTEYEFDYLENTYQNVLYVLECGSLLPENVIYQATFKQGSGVYKKIGNTYFCYQ